MGPAVQADDFIRCACVLVSLPTVSYSPRSCPSAQSSATYLVAGKWRVANCKQQEASKQQSNSNKVARASKWQVASGKRSRAAYIRCGQTSEPDERLFSLTMHPSGSPLDTKMSTLAHVMLQASRRGLRAARRGLRAVCVQATVWKA